MARMIGELLDFTRGRLGGGIPVEPHPGDLSTICREVMEELEASRPGARLHLQVDGHGYGEWDAGRLSQALSNLVGNALQYSPEGSPVRVTVDGHAWHEVVLTVHNEGPSIPAELLPELFEPFRRGPRARRDANESGLGLGLYIVRQIVLAHGGSLEAESREQWGTTFTARLPRAHSPRPLPVPGIPG
jgi:signal transduction histidine kinase